MIFLLTLDELRRYLFDALELAVLHELRRPRRASCASQVSLPSALTRMQAGHSERSTLTQPGHPVDLTCKT